MDKIDPLFTASATATGGRNGHTASSDGQVKADLSVPKEMGGPGKPDTATPEHLFAAGYAACFGGAIDFVGKQQKKDASGAKVTCEATIGKREGGGFGLSVKLRIEDKSLSQSDLEALAHEAHDKICPYSHATRGNVPVELEVVVALAGSLLGAVEQAPRLPIGLQALEEAQGVEATIEHRPRRAVGPVTELVGRGADPRTGVGGHDPFAGQGLAHRGHGESGAGGDVGEGDGHGETLTEKDFLTTEKLFTW